MGQSIILVLTAFMVILERPVGLSNFKNTPTTNCPHKSTHKCATKCSEESTQNKKKSAEYWYNQAQELLDERLASQPITGVAKNIIMFLGNGIFDTTFTAARAHLKQYNKKTKDETLSFERLPYGGYSQTATCADTAIPDSACSATAYLCGIKANKGTIGVTAAVECGDCTAAQNETNIVYSITRASQLEGKRTGVVTTARITQAFPAAVYAHSANSAWESDTKVIEAEFSPEICLDIAAQLIQTDTGSSLNVILGDGESNFLPKKVNYYPYPKGCRSDKRNLIEEWKTQKKDYLNEYVSNKTSLFAIPSGTRYLLGLFGEEVEICNKPTLSEMTEEAIKFLSQGKNGYFLFVHDDRAMVHGLKKSDKDLMATIEFHKAVQIAVDATNQGNTLLIVIFESASENCPEQPMTSSDYTSSFTQESVYKKNRRKNVFGNISGEKKKNSHRDSDIAATDDVKIYASGPWAHLFTGFIEPHVISHVLAYACCVGNGRTACDDYKFKR